MKVVFLSDIHMVGAPRRKRGVDVAANLRAAVAEINTHHADAAFCVLSGDLADRGAPAEYDRLNDILAELTLPLCPIPGNHDRHDGFRRAFPDCPRAADGAVLYERDTPAGVFLFLDSLDDDEPLAGRLGAARRAWLQERLAVHAGADLYLVIHHPPFFTHQPVFADNGLIDGAALGALLAGRAGIRHMFIGHMHRPIHGVWQQIPWSVTPSLYRQFPACLRPGQSYRDTAPLPPLYGVAFLTDGDVTVHIEELAVHSAITAGSVSPGR